jgi:hypothetical protein
LFETKLFGQGQRDAISCFNFLTFEAVGGCDDVSVADEDAATERRRREDAGEDAHHPRKLIPVSLKEQGRNGDENDFHKSQTKNQ